MTRVESRNVLIDPMNARVLKIAFLMLTGLVALAGGVYAQTLGEQELPEFETAIKQAMLEGQIPSMTVAVVKGDEVIWTNGYGYANVWARTPAVPSTVYLIGSTFKAMSTIALLQEMEAGSFKLDDPVNKYLGDLHIRNERKDRPVTFRHLLTHTSGMPESFSPYPVWGEQAPPGIESFLANSLRVESAPGEKMVYSNMGYTLVGYLVEKMAGMDFKKVIQKNIFKPLEMESTAFSPTPEMIERLAIPYIVDPSTGSLVPTEQLKATEWPAGIVYGTVLDMANWMIMNLNDGNFRGRHLIGAETLDMMQTRQYDHLKGRIKGLWGGEEAGFGLTWWTDTRHGERYFAHSGSVSGYTAFLQGNRDQRIGVVILSNGNSAHRHLIKLADEIMEAMEEMPAPAEHFGN